jgi:signal transduction histidine kinase
VTRALRLASVAAAALVAGSLLLRVANPFGAPPPDPSDIIPHLWGIGALLLLVLTSGWAPTIGWSASVIAAAAAALGTVGLVRELRAAGSIEPVPMLGAVVVVALVVPAAIAAAYATWGGRRSPMIAAGAWLAVAVLAMTLFGGFVSRTLGGERGGVPEWVWMTTIGLLLAIGLIRDMRPAFARTKERLAAGDTRRDPAGGALFALRVFLDEVVPGREAGRAEAAESERGRLAADLHADVLPSLRRALAEAEAGGTVERLAADLRSAVEEVESMLLARRSIVLEEMGLLAGIEWLAERVEDRSEVRVEIEVEGTAEGEAAGEAAGEAVGEAEEPGDGGAVGGLAPARPPRDVERAAFRVAQLALDNVVRHAPAATTVIRVIVLPVAVRLRIEDDGDGPPVDEAAAARSGRRGIADMRAEARAAGAALEVRRGAGGRGTAVEFRWPA